MNYKKMILFTGLFIILSGCSINTTEKDIYDSNSDDEIEDESKITNDESNNEYVEINNDVNMEKDDIKNLRKIGEMSNGEELYYDGGQFYFKSEFGETIGIKRESDIEVLSKGYPSRPKISPNKERAAFIDYIGFEVIGNLFIYDSETKAKKQVTNYEEGEGSTVKALEWLDNDKIFLIVGYSTGTITQGGSLYLYNTNKDELDIVLSPKDKSEFVDVKVSGKDVVLTTVVWTDDNYTEYEYIEKRVSILELLKSRSE